MKLWSLGLVCICVHVYTWKRKYVILSVGQSQNTLNPATLHVGAPKVLSWAPSLLKIIQKCKKA